MMPNPEWQAELIKLHEAWYRLAKDYGSNFSMTALASVYGDYQRAIGVAIYAYRLGQGTVYIWAYHKKCTIPRRPVFINPVHDGFPPSDFECPTCGVRINSDKDLTYDFAYKPKGEEGQEDVSKW